MSDQSKSLAQRVTDGIPGEIREIVDSFSEAEIALIIERVLSLKNAHRVPPAEIGQYILTCHYLGLHPLKNQIYAIPRCNKQEGAFHLTIQTGIDGLRAIAHRTGRCTGIESEPILENGRVVAGRATVYRDGHPYTAVVAIGEYTTNEFLWASKPGTMIAKVAESHALRKAFPEAIGTVYSDEEMGAAPQTINQAHGSNQSNASDPDERRRCDDKLAWIKSNYGNVWEIDREAVRDKFEKQFGHELKLNTRTPEHEIDWVISQMEPLVDKRYEAATTEDGNDV